MRKKKKKEVKTEGKETSEKSTRGSFLLRSSASEFIGLFLFRQDSFRFFFFFHFTFARAPFPRTFFPVQQDRSKKIIKNSTMGRGCRALVVAAVVCASAAVLGVGGRHGAVAAAPTSSAASAGTSASASGRSLAATDRAPSSSITSADVQKTTLALLEAAELQAAVSDSMVREKRERDN